MEPHFNKKAIFIVLSPNLVLNLVLKKLHN